MSDDGGGHANGVREHVGTDHKIHHKETRADVLEAGSLLRGKKGDLTRGNGEDWNCE